MANRNPVGRPKGTPKTGGRQKGTPNKTSKDAKENIQEVFERLGGVDRMHAFFEGAGIEDASEIKKQFEDGDLSHREFLYLLRKAQEQRATRELIFFEKIYPKLLPHQIVGTGKNGAINITIHSEDEGL